MSYNPFTVLPITLCDASDLPQFAQCQSGTSYAQLRSQVGGLLILPVGATGPDDWQMEADWADVVDNSNTDNTKAKYIVGRGSFLPNGLTEINLSGGRLLENRERFYRLTFNVLNLNDGHADFGRKLQKNVRDFDVWIQTIGDRIIGGSTGMRPIYVNAEFPFTEGQNDREVMTVTMDFTFEQFPAMTAVGIDLSGVPIGSPTSDCNCTIQGLLNDLQTFNSDADAAGGMLAGGGSGTPVSIGGSYWAGPGHDRAASGTLIKRLS